MYTISPSTYEVTLEMIQRAAELARHYQLFETRLLPSAPLSERCGREILLKCECEQRTGSFKVRGALARLGALSREERARGVIAASAGNHALGVGWACRALGIPGLVVLPQTVPAIKRERLEQLLIKIRRHGAGYDEAEGYARALAAEAEATFVSPFDDPWVIAGNGGTLALELRQQLPALGAVVAPLGGGGLAAGLALGLQGVPVLGVNTEASPAMARSLAEGRVFLQYPSAPTLAEGLEGGVSPSTVALCRQHLAGVQVVAEQSIAEAICFLARQHRLVVEGSGAAGVAALLEGQPLPGEGPLVVVLSGSNIDRERLRGLFSGAA